MKILLLSDVHHRPGVNRHRQKRTITGLKKIIDTSPCDLLVFLGDTVHGPDFKSDKLLYEKYLREVLDTTGNVPFATVFGNHDDECDMTKKEILEIISSYPNSKTDGENYLIKIDNETLIFLDSGAYYHGSESLYDVVKPEVIGWARTQLDGTKALLFQHIIVPDILELTDGKHFKKDVAYRGKIKEKPCPPDINTGELEALAPYLKAAVFGHDHKNSFELDLKGVRIIQCAGAGYECYEYPQRPTAKLLDTETLQGKTIKI